MPIFIIQFTDKPGCGDVRQKHLEAHLAWLDRQAECILLAGSLRETVTSAPYGALWLMEADSREAAQTLLEEDPFWQAGLRASVTTGVWTLANQDMRKRLALLISPDAPAHADCQK
ncbi:YciI family protein [uncultured Aquitalea sp.]|uniref:YciI family protein n=1 Tax=uncultured Aquitalea sp. TaxID=540272 RepID=UPI0025FD655A|nr:YciI family protein [uncultured Aquitalea sp.]